MPLSRTARRYIPVLLLVGSQAMAADAGAFTLFGYRLFGEPETTAADPDPERPDAQTYTIDLTARSDTPDTADSITAAVEGASQLWNDRQGKPPPSTPAFLSVARGETARIVAALRAEGYYGGTVAITIAGRRLEDIAPDATLPHPAKVTVEVTSGPLFTFGKITINARPPDPEDSATSPKRDTPEKLGLVSGQPARATTILQAEQLLLAGWFKNGHPLAILQPRDVIARHGERQLDVVIGADPRAEMAFGPVGISGTTAMDSGFVVRHADIPTGTPWDQTAVERAEKRLRDLQVFSSVRLEPAAKPQTGPDGKPSLPLTIQVAERPLRIFGFDASHSTLDGAGIGGYWQHRNLFGRAERLRLEARVNGINSATPADFTYTTSATLTQPGFFDPLTSLTTQLLAKREAPETYTQKTLRLQSGVAREFSPELTGSALLNAEFDDVDDAFGKRKLAFFSLPMELAYDGANDKFAPTTGFRAKLAAEPFIESRYGNTGVIARAGGSVYQAVDSRQRVVLASRLQLGSIAGGTAAQLPPDRLFFAGGGQSVRGYAYRSLGPRQGNGTVVGGRSVVESSFEVRVKVTDTIGVVPFVDAGAAYDSTLPDFSQPLKIGAGLGVRYYTGFGPIRADIAVPFSTGNGGARYALYLGLGESF